MEDTVAFYGETYVATYSEKLGKSAAFVQDLFNENEYWWRATVEGEFQTDIVYQDEPTESNLQPVGTVSEIVVYHKERSFFARVHQYVLPFGEVDVWGRPKLGGRRNEPDPKDLIFDNGIWYWVQDAIKVPKSIRTRRFREE